MLAQLQRWLGGGTSCGSSDSPSTIKGMRPDLKALRYPADGISRCRRLVAACFLAHHADVSTPNCDAGEGVPEHVERTINENASALKFRASEFTTDSG